MIKCPSQILYIWETHLELYAPVAMLNTLNAAVEVEDVWAAIKSQTGGSTTMSHLVGEVTPKKQGGVSEKGLQMLLTELVVAGSHKHAKTAVGQSRSTCLR